MPDQRLSRRSRRGSRTPARSRSKRSIAEVPISSFSPAIIFPAPTRCIAISARFATRCKHLRPEVGRVRDPRQSRSLVVGRAITAALKRAGADVLANDSRRLIIRNERLIVVGIDDLWSRRAEPARAFGDVNSDDCTIVLAHNPDTALYARHLRPGVMLSGHTHGGVVRIPFYGSPLKSILRIGKEFYSGLNRYEDFYIYTNRGLGTFWLRIRINCPPEVSRFIADASARCAPAERTPRQPCETASAEARPAGAVERRAPVTLDRPASTSARCRRDARSRDHRRNRSNARAASLRADVGVIAGKIASIAAPGTLEAAHARPSMRAGCCCIPGAVDPHTHLDAEMFSAHTIDDFESGTSRPRPPAASPPSSTTHSRRKADRSPTRSKMARARPTVARSSTTDFTSRCSIRRPRRSRKFRRVVERGVTSFKIFMMQGFEARARDFLRAFQSRGRQRRAARDPCRGRAPDRILHRAAARRRQVAT